MKTEQQRIIDIIVDWLEKTSMIPTATQQEKNVLIVTAKYEISIKVETLKLHGTRPDLLIFDEVSGG
jgi:hypothetical protein